MAHILLAITYALTSMVLIIYAVKSFRKPTSMGYYLGHVFVCSLLVLWSFALNLFTPNTRVMEIAISLEHIFTTWNLFFICAFMFKIEGHRINKKFRLITVVMCGLNSIVLATNPINHFTADYSLRTNGDFTIAVPIPRMFFVFHMVLCFSMIGVMIVFMVRKIVETSSYYRLKYSIIIATTIILIALNTVFMLNTSAVYDYSRFLFAIEALIYYFAAYDYTPRILIRNLQKYLADTISDATLLYDVDGNLLYTNKRAKELFIDGDITLKDNLINLLGLTHDGRTVVNHKDEYYEINYELMHDKREHYVASAFVCHNVTEGYRQLEREHRAAITDPLTKCYNRLGFFEKAPDFLKNNVIQSGYAVMVSGICDFKGINGLYGTKAGDKVLAEIARRFHDYHHEFPMLYARTAEGKFSCVIPFEHVDEIVNEMSHIQVNIEENVDIHVDMCHGFVVMSDESKGLEYFYELSLLALARCKKQMNSPVLEYSSDMAEDRMRKQMLLGAMHEAIENKEFFIELQPQIDLKEKRVYGAEALVRWNHPTMGRISPSEFIPLFEDNGFITKLDVFVWNETAKTIRRLGESGIYDGTISVNVSQIDIMSMDVAGILKKIVEENEIPPSKLHVEITESACVNNRNVLINTLEKLRSEGFVVEIDDFGSGYSSLNALMKIPFDVVKLDMMFMKEGTNGSKNDIILKAMSGMIHNLSAKIIVEGVETDENVLSAIHFNGDAAQGYHYSKPVPIDKFIEFVRKFNE